MRVPFTNRIYDLKSFFKKRPTRLKEGFWNVVAITGRQGTGKTYVAVREVFKNTPKTYKIKTNIKSLNIPDRNISFFDYLSNIFNDDDNNTIYLVDEMIKKYNKHSPIDKEFLSWLLQSRKHNRVFIFIYQDWKQCPTWLREVCNEIFITSPKLFNLQCTQILDGRTLELDNQTMQWFGETKGFIIYYRTLEICSMYDTLEVIPYL